MSEDFRKYLTQMFNDGAKTGNKADPKKVEHEMKHARNSTQVQLEIYENERAPNRFCEYKNATLNHPLMLDRM